MAAPMNLDELLVHADWLRRLAGHLARGGEDASDAVQETWVAALRSPPSAGRPPRPWLAEVLRNFVRKKARATRNRTAREVSTASAAELQAPSPEALLELAEAHRLIGELVVRLEEPYRTAIVLRYYRGQEPAEMGRQLGVPAGTVRWRLNEARRRLREALDEHHRATGAQWRPALLAGAPAGGQPLLSKGAVLIMSTKSKLAVAAALVAIALAAGTSPWWGARLATAFGAGHGAQVMPDPPATTEPAASPSAAGAVRAPGQPTALPRLTADPDATRTPTAARGEVPKVAPPRFLAPPPAPPPAINQPPSLARGSLPKEEIRRAMRTVIPALKACYTKLLEDVPHASGRMVVRFTVIEQEGVGRVSEATVIPNEPDAGAPELISPLTEQCIVNAVAELTFAPPVGGPVTVNYPFEFTASRSESPPGGR